MKKAKYSWLPVGKYYLEDSTESYIEIFEDGTALIVNVDLSEAQRDHDRFGDDIDVYEQTSVPVPYELVDDTI